MIISDENAINLLRDGCTLSEKCEAISLLIENRVFSDDAIRVVSGFSDSQTPLMFGITLGELSSVYLDIAGICKYSGDNQQIIGMISEAKRN